MIRSDIGVFVDESGSFAPDASSSRYYILCLVAHDQATDIACQISALEDSLEAIGLDRGHCIHAGPLIRREREYANMRREDRRRILGRMMSFIRKVDVVYRCFAIDKKFVSGDMAIHDFLLQRLIRFLIDKSDMFNSHPVLKIYGSS